MYWAEFETVGRDLFRFDTRVYLRPGGAPGEADRCIGAIVGKNPGSARPSRPGSRGLQPIVLGGDKLLPTVRNILLKAYERAGKRPVGDGYVQVLNLFYLCEKDLDIALMKIGGHGSNPRICPTQKGHFFWLWYAWGGANRSLKAWKGRFPRGLGSRHFYFDNASGAVVKGFPGHASAARHTQGMKQARMIEHLAAIV